MGTTYIGRAYIEEDFELYLPSPKKTSDLLVKQHVICWSLGLEDCELLLCLIFLVVFKVFLSSFDTSAQNHKTGEKELPPSERKGETVEEGVLKSSGQCLKKPNFSLSPLPTRCCCFMFKNYIKTVGYEYRNSGWLQNHLKSSFITNS